MAAMGVAREISLVGEQKGKPSREQKIEKPCSKLAQLSLNTALDAPQAPGLLEKWLIVGLGKEQDKMRLEHPLEPESEKMLKRKIDEA